MSGGVTVCKMARQGGPRKALAATSSIEVTVISILEDCVKRLCFE